MVEVLVEVGAEAGMGEAGVGVGVGAGAGANTDLGGSVLTGGVGTGGVPKKEEEEAVSVVG